MSTKPLLPRLVRLAGLRPNTAMDAATYRRTFPVRAQKIAAFIMEHRADLASEVAALVSK